MSMAQEQKTLESRDGTSLNALVWSPDGDESPHHTVILTHGLAEHMGRYQHVAEAFVAANWRVIGLELRGHGDSEGKRGHVDAWECYGEDLRAALKLAGEPCWILGHSMGGLVVLDLLLAREGQEPPAEVVGVVLTNPLLGVLVDAPAWKLALSGVLSTILPRLSLDNELDPTLISRDEAVVEAYTSDKKVFRTITPRWYTQMRAAMERVNAAAADYSTPLLMVTSDADGICNPRSAREFMERYGKNGAEQRHEGLYHEVLNEPEKEQVLEQIISWMSDRDE